MEKIMTFFIWVIGIGCLLRVFIILFSLMICYTLMKKRVLKENKKTINETIRLEEKQRYVYIKMIIINFLNGIEKYSLYKLGRIPSHILRNFFYKYIFGLKMSDNVVIYWGGDY